MRMKNWSLDSGAFSAWKSGKVIVLEDYADFCLKQIQQDSALVEIVSLDSIGNADQSMVNAYRLVDLGIPVMPVFHIGDPWEHLVEYCNGWDKVGLSCRFGESVTTSLKWIEQCFARAWPHKFHSFGWTSFSMLKRFPFHSADASTWSHRPAAFGEWHRFGKLSIRCKTNCSIYATQIDFYMDMERYLQAKWCRQMTIIEQIDTKGKVQVEFRKEKANE
jgi:hypothetical protein